MGPEVFAVAGHGMVVLAAFRPQIEGKKRTCGFIKADVMVLTPETTGLDKLLAKFDREHHHENDEARYIFAGDGVFGFGPEGIDEGQRRRPANGEGLGG